MELRQVRYFIVTAAELNFHKAADRLCLTQPALSRQIAALERDLGVRLLLRDKRHVELTSEGVAFLAHANALIALADEAVKSVQIAQADQPKMRLGIPIMVNRSIGGFIERLEQRRPDVHVDVQELSNAARLAGVLHGELEAAFVFAPAARNPALAVEVVADQELCLIAEKSHPLAASEIVELAAIASVKILLPMDQDLPAFTDSLLQWCRYAGFEPRFLRREHTFLQGLSLLRLLATEQAVCFWNHGNAPPPGTVVIRLRPPAPIFTFALAWRRGAETTEIRSLLDVVKQGRDELVESKLPVSH